MNFEKVTRKSFEDTRAAYTARDTIIYALGVGFGSKPLDRQHLKFLYEADLRAVPTMANVLGHPGMWIRDPQYGVDWKKLLHAEQRLEIHSDLPAEGKVRAEHSIVGIRDRGEQSGAFLYQRKSLFDQTTGQPLSSVLTTLLLRADGGCGDWGDAPDPLPKLPEAVPDHTADVQTTELAPLIYRLSGDVNPLHIDPDVAVAAGFERPILHGLATKGIACYAILKTLCDFNTARLKSMSVRFTSPVLPGDRLVFEFWLEGGDQIRFRALAPERGVTVLDRCSASVTT